MENIHKYSISAMCKVLKIARSTFYYKENPRCVDTELENAVIEEFRQSRNNYGVRKLKIKLARRHLMVSKKRIGKIMKKYNLVSNYTLRRKKSRKGTVNNDATYMLNNLWKKNLQ